MKRNRHNDIGGEILWQSADHQCRQRVCKAVCVSVLEGADGIPQRRKVWVQRPGSIVGRRVFDTRLAPVGRRPGVHDLGDKGAIAVSAAGSRKRRDDVPAGSAEMRARIHAERLPTTQTVRREYGAERKPAPSEHVREPRRHQKTLGEPVSGVKVVALRNGVIYEIRLTQAAFLHMVKLTEVSKIYVRGHDRICALDQVTLDIAAGTFCAFVGPSGCGKSTLLNLIAGLDAPTSGTLHLDGRSTAGYDSEDWTRTRRQSIGIVFQAFHLIAGLTVEENVAFPLLLRGEHGQGVRARVAEVLALVGMTHRAGHRPAELSGGEQQRVAVARAVVHQPKVLLADEPTGNLDSHHGAEIIELLRTLVDDFRHTVLLVTHSTAAAQAADYVWAMKDGRLTTRTMRVAAAQGARWT